MSDAVLTVAQMRAAEQAVMDRGTSEWELMHRAGRGAALWVSRMAAGRPVKVLSGPGNNGGDGYVIAESLRSMGLDVTVIAPIDPKTETASKAKASFGGIVQSSGSLGAPVVVDCLFGYGLDREVAGDYAKLLDELKLSHCFKIAIDVPSSVGSDDGTFLGPCFEYDLTLALGAWKPAHFLMPTATIMGAKRLVPLDLPTMKGAAELTQRPVLAVPPADAHKYKRGLVAVVEGAMPGAGLLASMAAMRAGAGYVKFLGDHSHPDAPADLVLESGDLEDLLSDDRISCVLVGPGLGRTQQSQDKLKSVLASGKPCVIDADALRLLDQAALSGTDPAKIVLTPHEGELTALCEAFDVTAPDKLGKARGLHEATGVTVLAKGPDTILTGFRRTIFFPRGSSWLSVAGSGDVLAGILASRLAHQQDPLAASQEAVWMHNEAARKAGPAFCASDLARAVGQAFGAFL